MTIALSDEEKELIIAALDFWVERLDYGENSVGVQAHKAAGRYVKGRVKKLRSRFDPPTK